MHSATDPRLKELLHAITEEFPRFRMVEKRQSRLSRAIDRFLKIVTLGGQDRFITEYHTVIGDTLYLPDAWQRMRESDKVVLLRHERVHLRQRRRYGFFGMAFLYLVPLLPIGLALGRARIEWEAYTETLRATADIHGMQAAEDRALREHIIRRFTGPDYGWMWPFRRHVERWYDDAIDQIRAERSAHSKT